jgi:PAS domain-containing protein
MNERAIGVFTIDENVVVHSWDAWLAEITGISAGQASGQSLLALVPDLEQRGLLTRFQRVLREGVVEMLSPAFHHYLFRCAPLFPSAYFDSMQQRITIAPLREEGRIAGAIVTVEDVTSRLEEERNIGCYGSIDRRGTIAECFG